MRRGTRTPAISTLASTELGQKCLFQPLDLRGGVAVKGGLRHAVPELFRRKTGLFLQIASRTLGFQTTFSSTTTFLFNT